MVALAARFGRELESIDVGRGDHVLLWGENSAEWVAALGAAAAAALAAPFRGLAQTLLYADLRRRKGEKPFSEPLGEAL